MKENGLQSESRLQRVKSLRRLGSGVALVIAAALTVSSINRVYSVPEAAVQSAPYDGVTLYRGLFFGSGPVGSKIPTIVKVLPYFPAEYKNLEGQTIKYIQAKDPNYFSRFAREVESGDRARVAAAIRNANALHKEALLEVTRNSKTPFASQVQRLRNQSQAEPSADGVITDFVYCVILLSHIVLEINVLVATKVTTRELKGLSFDRYVDEIVRAVPKTAEAKP